MGALIVALCLLAGIGKAVSDSSAHGSARLIHWFPSWGGPTSWRNKYRNGEPAQGPRFLLSTTALVFLTDLWHFANAATWACIDAAVVLAGWPTYRWWAVAGVVLRRVVFEPMYQWLRKSS